MSAWDDLPVVGPIGHGALDWCSVHGDIPGDMSIVAHINATHDMTYEEYRALDQMRADRTGFDSFDDARRFKTGEVALPAPRENEDD